MYQRLTPTLQDTTYPPPSVIASWPEGFHDTEGSVRKTVAAITGPWIKNNGITVTSAQLLWQDAEGLITNVDIDGERHGPPFSLNLIKESSRGSGFYTRMSPECAWSEFMGKSLSGSTGQWRIEQITMKMFFTMFAAVGGATSGNRE